MYVIRAEQLQPNDFANPQFALQLLKKQPAQRPRRPILVLASITRHYFVWFLRKVIYLHVAGSFETSSLGRAKRAQRQRKFAFSFRWP